MNPLVYALLFFLSGFAGLLYQIAWLHMAFTHFGIITPVLSVVVSVFMLGLGCGSLFAGRSIEGWVARGRSSALLVYAAVEGMTALLAFSVPHFFGWGERAMFHGGDINSLRYLAASAVIIACVLFPACFCMGMTYPVMMAHLRTRRASSPTSFSFLYAANVLGAFLGATLTPFVLIEALGFRKTLWVGVDTSLLAAFLALILSSRHAAKTPPAASSTSDDAASSTPRWSRRGMLLALGLTGFVSMAYEVLWTRAFTPTLGTTVYAFAAVVSMYLASTWGGTCFYRAEIGRRRSRTLFNLYGFLSVAALLPVLLADPRLNLGWGLILLSIAPFCGLLGYITPLLIDRYALGNSRQAGDAYALNVAGSVIGPLFASYLLLPNISTQAGIIGLSIPLVVLMMAQKDLPKESFKKFILGGVLALALVQAALCRSDETIYSDITGKKVEIRRDSTATVLSFGEGMSKYLLVNGVGITVLTPLTKMMAHMPVFCYPGKPKTALAICFGMGTTYRSLLRWGLQTTAVELVPSVKNAFGYYFADASAVLRDPHGTIVIDDGRRYLKRTAQRYDIVTLDPPPPVEATGSGLLYSKEFYELVKAHLAPGGILQQWWPGGEVKILCAVARTLAEEFPYVRVYKGLGHTGFHFLASMQPIQLPSVAQAMEKMTPGVRDDFMEWSPHGNLRKLVAPLFAEELSLQALCQSAATISDDHPFNEYYLLRRTHDHWHRSYLKIS